MTIISKTQALGYWDFFFYVFPSFGAIKQLLDLYYMSSKAKLVLSKNIGEQKTDKTTRDKRIQSLNVQLNEQLCILIIIITPFHTRAP